MIWKEMDGNGQQNHVIAKDRCLRGGGYNGGNSDFSIRIVYYKIIL